MLRQTISRPVCIGIKHPSGAYDQIFFRWEYGIRLTVTFLIPWDALSDERTGLSFVCAAGPCQHSLSRVRVPWDTRPYFTVSDLRLPFSSPPTTPMTALVSACGTYERQTRPLVREGDPRNQERNCQTYSLFRTEEKSGRKPQMGALYQERLADLPSVVTFCNHVSNLVFKLPVEIAR
jgi:hypothetical protein